MTLQVLSAWEETRHAEKPILSEGIPPPGYCEQARGAETRRKGDGGCNMVNLVMVVTDRQGRSLSRTVWVVLYFGKLHIDKRFFISFGTLPFLSRVRINYIHMR